MFRSQKIEILTKCRKQLENFDPFESSNIKTSIKVFFKKSKKSKIKLINKDFINMLELGDIIDVVRSIKKYFFKPARLKVIF